MRKVLGMLTAFMAVMMLVACEGDRELDFRSVLDVDSGTILRLGDSLSDFEAVLGAGISAEYEWLEENEGITAYYFSDGVLYVIFLEEEAVVVVQTEASSRFQFKDMSFDMTLAEIRASFTKHDLPDDEMPFYFYDRFYDLRGRKVSNHEDARYQMGVIYVTDEWFGEGVFSLQLLISGWNDDIVWDTDGVDENE